MTLLDEQTKAQDLDDAKPRSRHNPADFDLVIKHRPGWRAVDFGELFRHRDLLLYWTWRTLKARHAQSALGIGWAIIQPVVNTLIFTVIFGRLVGVGSDGVPYPLFAFCGMVLWTYFSNALKESVESLTRYTSMLSKIYFPRMILPLSAVIGKLLDLGIATLVFLPVMFWYGVIPRLDAVFVVPAMIALLFLASLGIGLWLSALAIQYRDVSYGLTFAIQALMYVSPVVYPASVVPDRFRIIYGLNPVAGVIAAVRASVLDTGPLPWDLILPGAAMSLVLAASGLYYFRSRERLFADVA